MILSLTPNQIIDPQRGCFFPSLEKCNDPGSYKGLQVYISGKGHETSIKFVNLEDTPLT